MEKQILEVVSIFNSQFGSIYENCQANHKEFFKSLPLEIDCLVLKVYVGAEWSLVATNANNEQNSILFHEAKELKLTFRVCQTGEWLRSKLIDFREDTQPCQEVKKRILAKNGLTYLQRTFWIVKSLIVIAMLVNFENLMLVNSSWWKDTKHLSINGLKIFHPTKLENEFLRVCFQGGKCFYVYVSYLILML